MYRIEFVDDHMLPEGHDFMLVTNDAGSALLVYRESAVTPATLEDSWAAYRALLAQESPPPATAPRLISVDTRRLA